MYEFTFRVILPNKNSVSSVLNFLDMSGTPRYLTGIEPSLSSMNDREVIQRLTDEPEITDES